MIKKAITDAKIEPIRKYLEKNDFTFTLFLLLKSSDVWYDWFAEVLSISLLGRYLVPIISMLSVYKM